MSNRRTKDRGHGLWACGNCEYFRKNGSDDECCASMGVTAIDAPCAWATGSLGSPGFDFDPIEYPTSVTSIDDAIGKMTNEAELCLVESLCSWRREEIREARVKKLKVGEHITVQVMNHVRAGTITKIAEGKVHLTTTSDSVPLAVYASAILPDGTAQGPEPKQPPANGKQKNDKQKNSKQKKAAS